MNYFDADELGTLVEGFESIVQTELKDRIPEDFMGWLREETDFYSAPASAKHHGAYEGGLLEHSLNVYERMMKILFADEDALIPTETVKSAVLVSLFHDLCKINTYEINYRHEKQPDGKWGQVPYYTFRQDLPMGHGEKSVYLLIAHGVMLTEKEALAIRWHMGAYDNAVKGGARDMNEALRVSPLVLALQQADMQATFWDEEGQTW